MLSQASLSLIIMLTSYFLSLARHHYADMHAHLSHLMQLSIFNCSLMQLCAENLSGEGTMGKKDHEENSHLQIRS